MNGGAQGELLTHRVSGYYTSSQSSLAPLDSGMVLSIKHTIMYTLVSGSKNKINEWYYIEILALRIMQSIKVKYHFHFKFPC